VSNTYIEPGLKSLQYIQQTSDIFFPTSWLQAMLGSHKSKEARLIVEKFISDNPNYPEHLRNKIFEAAWIMMKQQTYVGPLKSATATTKASAGTKKTSANAKKTTKKPVAKKARGKK
jgi:aminopeptidase N